MPSDDKSSYSGIATNFAGLYDQIKYAAAKAAGLSDTQASAKGDSGVGAPRLGTVNTANAYGVAVPTEYLRKNLGNDPADWRSARAQLTVGDKTVMVPFVDIGPGSDQRKKGVIVDVTKPLSDAMGGFDYAKANLKIIPNVGPDYKTNQDEWYNEQDAIAKQFPNPKEPAPWTSAAPTPSWAGMIPDRDEIVKRRLPVQALTAL
jgi:hypothetical protein